jgi:hypothetical protein
MLLIVQTMLSTEDYIVEKIINNYYYCHWPVSDIPVNILPPGAKKWT